MPQDHEIRICAYPYRFAGDGRTTLLTEGDPGEGHAISAVVKVDTSGRCCSKRDMRALLCTKSVTRSGWTTARSKAGLAWRTRSAAASPTTTT